jgi:hypothetical protein
VAMVMATSTVDPLKALQAQDQPFVAQLRLDNLTRGRWGSSRARTQATT